MKIGVKLMVAVVTVLTVVCIVWANTLVQTKSIMHDAYLGVNTYKQNTTVFKSEEVSVDLGEEVIFRVNMQDVSKDTMRHMFAFVSRLDNVFNQADIASIVHTTDYRNEIVEVFLPEYALEEESESRIGSRVDNLMNRDFGKSLVWQDENGYHFQFVVFPGGDEEVENYRKAQQVLCGYMPNSLEMNFGPIMRMIDKVYDVVPSCDPVISDDSGVTVDVYGWSIWRTLINTETMQMVYSVLFFGSVVPIILIFAALRSWRQTLIVIAINCVVIATTRASIVLWDSIFPWSFHEETYTILAYIPAMILTYSFVPRTFKTYNAHFWDCEDCEDVKYVRKKTWSCTQNDVSLKNAIAIVTILVIVDFALFMIMQHYDAARSIFEVGLLATVATVVLVGVVRYVLPLAHGVIGGVGKRQKNLVARPWMMSVLQFLGNKNIGVFTSLCIATLTAMVIWGYENDHLIVDSNPGAFIRSTDAGVVMTDLEKEHRPGSALYKIGSNTFGDLLDATTIERIDQLSRALREERVLRTVMSPTDLLHEVLSGTYEEYANCLTAMCLSELASRNDLLVEVILEDAWWTASEDTMARYLFSLGDSSIVVMGTSIANLTRDMLDVRQYAEDKMNAYCASDDSCAKAIGYLAEYPEVDAAITYNAVKNYIYAPLVIMFVMLLFFLQQKRTYRYAYSSLRASIVIVVPFIAATTTTLGAMMIFHIPLDIASVAISSVTIAAAADLPIFLFLRYAEEVRSKGMTNILTSDAMADEVSRSTFDVVINGGTYAPLTISSIVIFLPIQYFGIMLIVALATCWSVTLLMMSLYAWVYKA